VIEEEKILGRFRVIKKNDPTTEFLTSTEIAEKIFEEKQITNAITRQIGMVLNKYQFEKISKRTSGQSIKKWAVKEITVLDKAGESSF
jgi:glutamyl/glutaminyl-tRNA synthetase